MDVSIGARAGIGAGAGAFDALFCVCHDFRVLTLCSAKSLFFHRPMSAPTT
jgi:hypothetical protein